MSQVCDDSTSDVVTYLKVLRHVLARLIQLVLVQDDVKHLRRTLGQLLSRHQLDVDVARLSLKTVRITRLLSSGQHLKSN